MEETDLRYRTWSKCAVEESFGLKKDIRGSVPFVHLLSVYHHIDSPFTQSSAIRQGHSSSHTI